MREAHAETVLRTDSGLFDRAALAYRVEFMP